MTKAKTYEPGQVHQMPIGKLVPDPDQPRKSFDEQPLQELAESLKHGVQVPLLVRPNGKAGKFVIHDGERRFRAAKLAKIKTLPVLVLDPVSDALEARAGQVAANSFREQLKPMELARLMASLRSEHFKSDNDIAAYIEAHGLPAMTAKQIRELITLTELPEWAQDMMDAGTLEVSAATHIKVAMREESVLVRTKEGLEREIDWYGRATGKDARQVVSSALRDQAVDLLKTERYYTNPVHFDAKVACKGCEHLVKHDGALFCLNREAYEEKNAEARAAGLLPGGEKPDKAPPTEAEREEQAAEEKAAKRETTLTEKVRDYLHAYLINRIVQHMPGAAGKRQIDITDELLAWHAMRHPGQSYYGGRAAVCKFDSAEAAEIKSIEDLLKAIDLASAKLAAAAEVAHELRWRETQVLCHELWGSAIEKVWELDEGFLHLFRKAELIHLVEQHGLADAYGGIDGWGKLKVSEIKAALVDRADQIQRPAMLQAIYEDVEEPFQGFGGWSGDD